ncbi:ArsR/SmtB family transcription factor [Salinirussus salinus]|jgi:DNA-binding transcriptional ArsR family regulator|uniref:ArsR/SmtB family transcription factor n=1 Tax=Salinirussus salinus TaxID=1198300 RepID=UPI0013578DA5|nr:helix-turn-helix domain-containing protein [Salinirussus salinus]
MNGLLPRESTVDQPEQPQVVGLDDGDSADAFSVLSSDTARSVLGQLYREPATQSELADELGLSIQNVAYHVERLEAADLLTVVDSWYSEKGRNMDVYAPAGDPLVLVAGGGDGLDEARRAVAGRPEDNPDRGAGD